MPGLQYCSLCGVIQRDELPDKHEDTVDNMSNTVLVRELRYVSTCGLTSGPRGRMSAAQTGETGRFKSVVDKYCKEQYDRCRELQRDAWDCGYNGCAERWSASPRLRISMHDARKQSQCGG